MIGARWEPGLQTMHQVVRQTKEVTGYLSQDCDCVFCNILAKIALQKAIAIYYTAGNIL
jgi:hypothetical protein